MRDIKFQYIWKHEGMFVSCSFDLDEIADGKAKPPRSSDGSIMRCWELIARRQYTGLKDKNGVEIYEGDIVYAFGAPLEVKWITDGWFADCELTGVCEAGQEWEGSCEVIGNIHQNPDLIKE